VRQDLQDQGRHVDGAIADRDLDGADAHVALVDLDHAFEPLVALQREQCSQLATELL